MGSRIAKGSLSQYGEKWTYWKQELVDYHVEKVSLNCLHLLHHVLDHGQTLDEQEVVDCPFGGVIVDSVNQDFPTQVLLSYLWRDRTESFALEY